MNGKDLPCCREGFVDGKKEEGWNGAGVPVCSSKQPDAWRMGVRRVGAGREPATGRSPGSGSNMRYLRSTEARSMPAGHRSDDELGWNGMPPNAGCWDFLIARGQLFTRETGTGL